MSKSRASLHMVNWMLREGGVSSVNKTQPPGPVPKLVPQKGRPDACRKSTKIK